jgi:hypothetical protein
LAANISLVVNFDAPTSKAHGGYGEFSPRASRAENFFDAGAISGNCRPGLETFSFFLGCWDLLNKFCACYVPEQADYMPGRRSCVAK